MKITILVFLVLTWICFDGCATILDSSRQTLSLTASDGRNHEVEVTYPSGKMLAKLPLVVTTQASTFTDFSISVLNSECTNQSKFIVQKNITNSFWINFLFPWGFIVDPITGAMWTYDKTAVIPISKKPGCF